MSERIQKFLATLGVASRREVERMIDEGRIEVNGKPAEPGQHVDRNDSVRIDGRPVAMQRKAEAARVLIYKKRTGELVTRDDPEGRRTVFRKLPKLTSGRWIAIGRLDINTSGLLLFTNHGELARRLTHPSFEVPRTYAVRILGTVDAAVIARWKAGVELEDGNAKFERVETGVNEDGEGANQWFHVTVREGRNRLVRRLIESQKLQVSRLIRISYGPIELGRGIKSGTAREATPAELLALLDAVQLSQEDVGIASDKPQRRTTHGKPDAASVTRPGRSRPSKRDGDDDGGFESNKRRAKRDKSTIPRVPTPVRPARAKPARAPDRTARADAGDRRAREERSPIAAPRAPAKLRARPANERGATAGRGVERTTTSRTRPSTKPAASRPAASAARPQRSPGSGPSPASRPRKARPPRTRR
jgi:pseudouridine synthase